MAGCKFVVPIIFGVCPQWGCACVLLGGLYLVLLVVRTTSSDVFWSFFELSMTLGSLSANGYGCVPVLLVVWHGAFITGAFWPLGAAESLCLDEDLWEISHRLILRGARRFLVVQCPGCGPPTSKSQA